MPGVVARQRNGEWEYRFEGAKFGGKRKQFSKSGFNTKKGSIGGEEQGSCCL